MKRVVLLAFLLTGCRAISPEAEKAIEKDLTQLEIDMMKSQLDSAQKAPETH